jgi:hypothetical protein
MFIRMNACKSHASHPESFFLDGEPLSDAKMQQIPLRM